MTDKKVVPIFNTEEEVQEFWATHDSADYLEDIPGAPCPLCGSHTVRFADDLTFAAVLDHMKIKIPNLTGIRCSTCKNYSFDADSSKIIEQTIQDAKNGGVG